MATGTIHAADLELKPETLKTWNEYVQKATAAMQQRLHGGGPYFRVEENADRRARVRAGEIVVWPACEPSPKRVPSGLIHDWIGAAFIPGVRIEDILSVVRNYARYKDIYKPGVLDARLLNQTRGEDRFSLLLRNGSYLTRTTVDGDFDSTYGQVDDRRWYAVSCSTRLQEIEDYGQPGEHKLPPDEGHGYIWRVCRLSQFEERDGGVNVEDEMIALSRDVPAALRWMAGPVIRRVAREMLTTSIEKTRVAVGAKPKVPDVSAKRSNFNESGVCASVGGVGCLR
jgi:hypothetical protein